MFLGCPVGWGRPSVMLWHSDTCCNVRNGDDICNKTQVCVHDMIHVLYLICGYLQQSDCVGMMRHMCRMIHLRLDGALRCVDKVSTVLVQKIVQTRQR